MNRIGKQFLVMVLTIVLLLGVLGIAQARRARLGGDETYYDLVACTDGLIAQLAYGYVDNSPVQPDPAHVTAISLTDNAPILDVMVPFSDGPVDLVDTSGVSQQLQFSGTMMPVWTTVLLPGTRVALSLDLVVGGTPVNVNDPFSLTVQDCTLTNPPADRDSLIAEVLTGNLDLAPGSAFCTPDALLTSTIDLSDETLNRPISDVNVAMYLKTATSSSPVAIADVRARLTSPNATTVELFDFVGGEGTNFGSRGSNIDNELIGDPMADFVLDDSSDFHFSQVQRTCSTPNLVIPDDDPVGAADQIVIPAGGSILDMNVAITTTHTWVGDLIYTLEHVDTGTSVTLIDRPGVPSSVFGCGVPDIIDATIDDEAINGVEGQCAPSAPAIGPGRYIGGDPADATLLAAFDGEDLSGTWRLTVSDNSAMDTGMLGQWCLDSTAAPVGIEAALTVSAPFVNTAVQPHEPLSLFNGDAATGTWTLEVCNRSTAGGEGVLDTWFLEVEVLNEATTDAEVYLPLVAAP